jgi:hypothetical protein
MNRGRRDIYLYEMTTGLLHDLVVRFLAAHGHEGLASMPHVRALVRRILVFVWNLLPRIWAKSLQKDADVVVRHVLHRESFRKLEIRPSSERSPWPVPARIVSFVLVFWFQYYWRSEKLIKRCRDRRPFPSRMECLEDDKVIFEAW